MPCAMRSTLRVRVRAGSSRSATRKPLRPIALARLEAERRPEPAAGLQPDRHGAAHQSRPRALSPRRRSRRRCAAMRGAVALEFDLADGKRGERDDHLRGLLCELTGAEDATVVNNNAAAVLLVLNTLAQGPRGDRLARRADRDRRRLPHAGHHDARRRQARRGRHHQPHASARTMSRRDRPEDRADPQGAHLELPHRGLHRGGSGARACRARAASTACRSSTISAPARSSISRASASRTSRRCARRSPRAPTSSPSPATSCSAGRRPASSSAARI